MKIKIKKKIFLFFSFLQISSFNLSFLRNSKILPNLYILTGSLIFYTIKKQKEKIFTKEEIKLMLKKENLYKLINKQNVKKPGNLLKSIKKCIRELDFNDYDIRFNFIKLDIGILNYLSEGNERFTEHQIDLMFKNSFLCDKIKEKGDFLKLIKEYIQKLDFKNGNVLFNFSNLDMDILNYLSEGDKKFTEDQIKLMFNNESLLLKKRIIYDRETEKFGAFLELVRSYLKNLNIDDINIESDEGFKLNLYKLLSCLFLEKFLGKRTISVRDQIKLINFKSTNELEAVRNLMIKLKLINLKTEDQSTIDLKVISLRDRLLFYDEFEIS